MRVGALLALVAHVSTTEPSSGVCGLANPLVDLPYFPTTFGTNTFSKNNGSCLRSPSSMSPLDALYRKLRIQTTPRQLRMLMKSWPASILNAAIAHILISDVLGYDAPELVSTWRIRPSKVGVPTFLTRSLWLWMCRAVHDG